MSLEYVTGTEFVLANDSILVFVLNTDQLTGSAHILIYQNNVGGEVLFADTGVMTVAPHGTAIVGVSLLTGGSDGLKIYVSSNDLVPSVRFARLQGGRR